MEIEIGKSYLVAVNDEELGVKTIKGTVLNSFKEHSLHMISYAGGWLLTSYLACHFKMDKTHVGKTVWLIDSRDIVDCIGNV